MYYKERSPWKLKACSHSQLPAVGGQLQARPKHWAQDMPRAQQQPQLWVLHTVVLLVQALPHCQKAALSMQSKVRALQVKLPHCSSECTYWLLANVRK